MLTPLQINIFFGILITTGYLYTLDWPQSLETPLKQPPYSLSSIQYNMIYFATMLPMALVSIPLGMLIDRIKIKYSVWIFLGMQMLAQLSIAVVFFFVFKGMYFVILALRLIYGLTTQSAFTIQSVVIERTTPKKDLDLALNLCFTFPLIFQALNSLITTSIYDVTGKMYIPLLIGVGFCFIALISGLVMANRVQKHSIVQEVQVQEQQQKCNIHQIKNLSWEFWLFIFMIFMGECCNGPFLDNLNDLLVKRFGVSYTTSGILNMIPCGLSPFFSIIWFRIIKKHQKKRRLLFVIMSLLSFMIHLIMILIPNSDQPSALQYVFISLSLLCFSSGFAGYLGLMQVSVGMIVPQNLKGTAYGAIGAVDALGMALMPVLNGVLTSSHQDIKMSYLNLQYLYLPLAGLYLSLSLYIFFSKSQIYQLFDCVRGDILCQQIKQSLLSQQNKEQKGWQMPTNM